MAVETVMVMNFEAAREDDDSGCCSSAVEKSSWRAVVG